MRNLGNLEVGVYLSQGTGNLVGDNDIENSGVHGIQAFFAERNIVQTNV